MELKVCRESQLEFSGFVSQLPPSPEACVNISKKSLRKRCTQMPNYQTETKLIFNAEKKPKQKYYPRKTKSLPKLITKKSKSKSKSQISTKRHKFNLIKSAEIDSKPETKNLKTKKKTHFKPKVTSKKFVSKPKSSTEKTQQKSKSCTEKTQQKPKSSTEVVEFKKKCITGKKSELKNAAEKSYTSPKNASPKSNAEKRKSILKSNVEKHPYPKSTAEKHNFMLNNAKQIHYKSASAAEKTHSKPKSTKKKVHYKTGNITKETHSIPKNTAVKLLSNRKSITQNYHPKQNINSEKPNTKPKTNVSTNPKCTSKNAHSKTKITSKKPHTKSKSTTIKILSKPEGSVINIKMHPVDYHHTKALTEKTVKPQHNKKIEKQMKPPNNLQKLVEPQNKDDVEETVKLQHNEVEKPVKPQLKEAEDTVKPQPKKLVETPAKPQYKEAGRDINIICAKQASPDILEKNELPSDVLNLIGCKDDPKAESFLTDVDEYWQKSALYECFLCNFADRLQKIVIDHQNHTHKVSSKWQCSVCSYQTYNQEYLGKHVLKHPLDKPHRCSQCRLAFKFVPSLQTHCRTHGLTLPAI